VPIIRQTRDKRGFEHTLVLHTYHPSGGGPQRQRVLYMFCSPANLKVGRTALDAEVMEALEHTHPDLSFDWGSIPRETLIARPEQADRHQRRPPNRSTGPAGPASPQGRAQSRSAPPPPPSAPPAAVADDRSMLGRVLGASQAARIRQRYNDVVQRIGRRARTPEERDRLLERAQRLNPEEWTDEAGMRSQAATIDAALDAINTELPSRRRGRRGGRRREGERTPSGIMATGDSGGTEGGANHEIEQANRAESAGDAAAGDRDPDGSDSETTADGPEIPGGD
jgi:hypothetical protein